MTHILHPVDHLISRIFHSRANWSFDDITDMLTSIFAQATFKCKNVTHQINRSHQKVNYDKRIRKQYINNFNWTNCLYKFVSIYFYSLYCANSTNHRSRIFLFIDFSSFAGWLLIDNRCWCAEDNKPPDMCTRFLRLSLTHNSLPYMNEVLVSAHPHVLS